MFEVLKTPPPDKILQLSVDFRADDRPQKIDLGVGVYRDARGRTPVMRAVKAAERRLLDGQDSKAYVGLFGDAGFNDAMTTLIFGDAAPRERLRAIQAPGGGGALRLLFELVRRARPDAVAWLSRPTWPNHRGILDQVGLAHREYPYFDPASGGVDVDAMMAALKTAAAGDLVLLHGCCHNPTGANLTDADWGAVADLCVERGLIPFIDIAYQGFGDGLEADAAGVRALAARVPEMLVAASCSKNFGVYRDRVGCAFALARTPAEADVAKGNMGALGRVNHSMPPDHGAACVGMILNDAELRASWVEELDSMRARMLTLRQRLADALRARANSATFDFIAGHRGMFSLTGASPDQVARLREECALYMVGDGRINVAGLPEDRLDDIAAAFATVGLV